MHGRTTDSARESLLIVYISALAFPALGRLLGDHLAPVLLGLYERVSVSVTERRVSAMRTNLKVALHLAKVALAKRLDALLRHQRHALAMECILHRGKSARDTARQATHPEEEVTIDRKMRDILGMRVSSPAHASVRP